MKSHNAGYLRKSTDREDKQTISIENQKLEILAMSQADGRNIDVWYIDKKSAKEPFLRQEFTRLIADIQDNSIDYLYTYEVDRLSRNDIESGYLKYYLQRAYVNCIRTKSRNFNPEDSGILLGILLDMSSDYVRKLAKDSLRGMRYKAVKLGWYPHNAPIGYLNEPYKPQGERTIVTDPERFSKMREVWDLALEGIYSIPQIVEIAKNEIGLTPKPHKRNRGEVTYHIIRNALNNPFYYGSFLWEGELHLGAHKPMVTYEEFQKVQESIFKHKPKPRVYKLYNRMFVCSECGSYFTPDVKKKRLSSGKFNTHIYWKCCKKKCKVKSIKNEKLEEQVLDILSTIELKDRFFNWCLKWVNYYIEQEFKKHKQNKNETIEKIKVIDEELEHLTKEYYSLKNRNQAYLEEGTFLNLKKQYINEKIELNNKLSKSDINQGILLDQINKDFNFIESIVYKFENGSIEERIDVLNKIARTREIKEGNVVIQSYPQFPTIKNLQKNLKSELNESNREILGQQILSGNFEKQIKMWCPTNNIIRNVNQLIKCYIPDFAL